MATDEFSLIDTYFARQQRADAGVALAIGDDCALLSPTPGMVLAVTTDTLVGGVHFPDSGAPRDIGQRSLRVNLSDLAAMGAQPRWFQLALTLPRADPEWLAEFSAGLFAVAEQFSCVLVGGNMARGPLSVTITALGEIPAGAGLTRSGAQVGDGLYVTGSLGDAAAGLALLKANKNNGNSESEHSLTTYLLGRYWRPTPRLAEGLLLRGIASAAIDISDGLLADLGHIARSSGVGAEIEGALVPLSENLINMVGRHQAQEWALSAGDDYELCFTVPERQLAQLATLIDSGQLMATRIGTVVADSGVSWRDGDGKLNVATSSGYRHF